MAVTQSSPTTPTAATTINGITFEASGFGLTTDAAIVFGDGKGKLAVTGQLEKLIAAFIQTYF